MMDPIATCILCPLYKLLPENCYPVGGSGNHGANILFVSDYPSQPDIISNELLSGRVGTYFEKSLESVGIQRDEVFVSSLLHCRPLNKNKERQPRKDEIEACKKWVWQDIKSVNPKVIVTLGLLPTKKLGQFKSCKMADMVGQHFQLKYHSAVLFPCYHPKYVMTRSAEMEKTFTNVLLQVKDYIDDSRLSERMGRHG